MTKETIATNRLGLILLALFFVEGIIGKSSFGGIRLSPNMHIILTAAVIGVLFAAHFFTAKSGSEVATPVLKQARLAVAFLIVGGGFSAMLRVHFLVNFSFWIIWSSNFVAVWWSLPFLLRNFNSKQILEFLLKINSFFMFLMVLLFPVLPYLQGRLGGIFDDPTAMGRFSSLTCILCFVHFFSIKKTERMLVFLFFASFGFLILTRTRASILAFFLAATFIVFFSFWSKYRWAQVRAQYALFLVFMFLVFLWPSGAFEEDVIGPVLTHFRLNADMGEAYASARGMNWEQSLRDMADYGFFGQGFLVKFGITDLMIGNKAPGYDWTNANDPLNMVLTLAKQAGWFTATAFVCLLLILFDGIRRAVDTTAQLSILGIMMAGLVFGLIDGNWLITFGEPNDRLCMIVLAMMVSRRKSVKSIDT